MNEQNQKLTTLSINHQIDYRNIDLLKLFITEQGQIIPKRLSGVTVQQQKKLTKSIKQARALSLLPFIKSNLI